MIYLKVNVSTYNNRDVQYIEVGGQTPGAFKLTDGALTSNDPWAIRVPSDACVQIVTAMVPGCEVHVYNRVSYLMSPKALLYFPTKNKISDVVVFTFHMPDKSKNGNCHSVLFNLNHKGFWHNFWVARGHDSLSVSVKESLGVEKTVDDFSKVGSFQIRRKMHEVIQLRTCIYYNVFHCHLTWEEIQTMMVHLGVPKDQPLLQTHLPQVLSCPSGALFSHMLIVSRKLLCQTPDRVHGNIFDSCHREALTHLMGYKCQLNDCERRFRLQVSALAQFSGLK